MIILEGPDGSGKSTLAKRLARALVVDYAVESIPSRGPRGSAAIHNEVFDTLSEQVGLNPIPLKIWDRFLWSEHIYGRQLRGTSAFNAQEMIYATSLISTLRIPVVLCLPPWEVVAENWERRTDDKAKVRDRLPEIYREYKNMESRYFLYDYTKDISENIYRLILDQASRYYDKREARRKHYG